MAGKKLFRAVVLAVAVAGLLRLFHFALNDSGDFTVYWRAVQDWVGGRDPWLVDPARQGFVFKYPPWMLAPFLPLAVLTLAQAKAAWFFVELAALAYSVRWLLRRQVSEAALVVVTPLYWWIWYEHFAAGQLTLVILWAGLWAFSRGESRPDSPMRAAVGSYVLSAKIFTLVSFVPYGSALREKRVLFRIAVLVAAALIATLFVSWYCGGSLTLGGIFASWLRSAASGSKELGDLIIRGQANHGLTAAVLRALRIPAAMAWVDDVVFLALALVLGKLWSRFGARLSPAERHAGWIALAAVVHPLSWSHSFVLGFPLAVLALDRAWKTGRTPLRVAALCGVTCACLLNPQVIGADLVRPFELAGIKSWGLLILGAVLARAA